MQLLLHDEDPDEFVQVSVQDPVQLLLHDEDPDEFVQLFEQLDAHFFPQSFVHDEEHDPAHSEQTLADLADIEPVTSLPHE